jgi:Fe-S-cluster-containing hydrogenase component 2
MKLITISEMTCCKDGICAAVCPINLIDFKQGEYPVAIKEAEELCIKCGHCVVVCVADYNSSSTNWLSNPDMITT